MKQYDLKPFTIPDSWESVSHFADWYMSLDMPIRFHENVEVFVSDDATSVCLFRHGQFQVELYLIYPTPLLQIHEHPNVEVIKMRLFNNNAGAAPTLHNGQAHGNGMRAEAEYYGFPLIAFQHWLKDKPSTVAASWKGETVGVKHEQLIKRFYPNAYIKNGYADITKTMGNQQNG